MVRLLPALLLSTATPAPPSCPATVRELRVRTAAGHVLAARLSLPVGTSRAPVVVMISGSGPHDRNYSTIADEPNQFFAPLEARLRCESVGALRFDEVGTGKSTGSYSAYATTATLADDVTALVDALRQQPGVDSARISLLGHSEGGAIAAMVAARRPFVAATVLLAAPVLRGDEIIPYQIAAEQREGRGYGRAARREHALRAVRDRWYQFFLRFSPARFYAELEQPVLILQGELDRRVAAVQADSILRLARAGGNRFVYCRRYPEHWHAFVGNDRRRPFAAAPDVLNDIAQFARLVLVEGRPPTSSGDSCRREPAGDFTVSSSAAPHAPEHRNAPQLAPRR